MNDELAKLIEKYKQWPDFYSVILGDVNTRSISGDTMLHAAVIATDRADVDQLIALGGNVNAAGDLGNTPLHGAASRGLVEIIRKLVLAGAKVDAKNEYGQTPIDLARLRHSGKNLKAILRALQGRT